MATWILVNTKRMWVETCCKCQTPFAMGNDLYTIAQERKEAFTFYCPNGHPQHYVTGETETDKLRRERDRLKQEAAYSADRIRELADERDAATRRASAARGQVTKLKKRAAAGVCPCCNRTFTDLARHMAGKHPGFIAEPTADETVRH